jgi:hypothetical protein
MMERGNRNHGARRPRLAEQLGIDAIEHRPIVGADNERGDLQHAIGPAPGRLDDRKHIAEREAHLLLDA